MRDMFEIEDLSRSLLGMHKIKYNILKSFDIGNDVDAFHIDYDSFVRFYSKYYKTNPELHDTDLIYCVAASIINTAAHYRHYFVKHNINDVKIFIYGSETDEILFNDAYSLVAIISKYIPNLYFIRMDKDPRATIKYVCEKYENNILLTKNKLDLALISPSISILHSNKDASIYYTSDNVYKELGDKDVKNIDYNLIDVVMSFVHNSNGCKKVSGYGYHKAIKKINNEIINGKIPRHTPYSNIGLFISDFNYDKKLDKTDIGHLKDNFDIISFSKEYEKLKFNKAATHAIENSIIDKFSKKDLNMLNAKYFTGFNSLSLAELFETVSKNTVEW